MNNNALRTLLPIAGWSDDYARRADITGGHIDSYTCHIAPQCVDRRQVIAAQSCADGTLPRL